MKYRWLIRSLITIVVSLFSFVELAQPLDPDIIIIVADDLDYNDLLSFNPHTDAIDTPPHDFSTPKLDRLANEGIRFTQFYANASVCSPSRVALMTGLYPQRFGVRRVFRECSEKGICHEPSSSKPLTLAERIQIHNPDYRTIHIGKWHLGVERHAPGYEYHPMSFGYGESFGFFHEALLTNIPVCTGTLPCPGSQCCLPGQQECCPAAACDVPDCSQGSYKDPFLWHNHSGPMQKNGDLSDLLTTKAVNEIKSLSQESPPLLMTLWYLLPHVPLPNHWSDKRHNYLELVKMLDTNVGLVLDEIDENYASKGRQALVFFMSDNGGEAGCEPPAGCGGHPDCIHGPGRPLTDVHLRGEGGCRDFGGKGTFYEGGIRVPAIMKWYGHLFATPPVFDRPVTAIDVVPTIMELLGAKNPGGPVDGVSFAGLLKGNGEIEQRYLFWESHAEGGSTAAPDGFDYAVMEVPAQNPGTPPGPVWKLLGTETQATGPNQVANSLFEITATNATEFPDYSTTMPGKVASLKQEYDTWRKAKSQFPHHVSQELNVKTITDGWEFSFSSGDSVVLIDDHPLLNPGDGAMSVCLEATATSPPSPGGSVLVQKAQSWRLVWNHSKELVVELPTAGTSPCKTPPVYLGQSNFKKVVLAFNHNGEQCAEVGKATVRVYVDGDQKCVGTYSEPIVRNPSKTVQVGTNSPGAVPRRPFGGTIRNLQFFGVNLIP